MLYGIYRGDYNAVEDALELIAEYKKAHPEHPVTLSLYNYLKERGYLP